MKVFVAGGTGVLGRPAVRALREAGHQVRATARGEEKARLVRSLGAEPVDVDLYDPAAVCRAIAGSDAVLRLTTKIASMMKMGKRGAWTETGRLRTVGARILADAAIKERVAIYGHESVVFVYADGGAAWLDEGARTDDGGTAILRATLEGEREAIRFTQAGGRGLVLRFGGFYGPDAPSTLETAQLARRRMLPQIGAGANYMSSINIPDAGRAVAAALNVPAGIYNVCDDTPVPFAEYLGAMGQALGVPPPRRLPAVLGRLLFGEVGRFFFRSLRVSNRRFKEAAGWAPEVKSVSEGWPRIAAEWRVSMPAAGAGGG
jgi:nucleoside-diphosphate-sugar epimerase